MINLQKQVNLETTDMLIQTIKSNHLENVVTLGGALADDLLGYKGLVGVNRAYNECSKGRLLYVKDTMYNNIIYINGYASTIEEILHDSQCYDYNIENNVPLYFNIINVGGINCVDRLSNELAIINAIVERINKIWSNAREIACIDVGDVFDEAEEMYEGFKDLIWLLYNYKYKFNGDLVKLRSFVAGVPECALEIILDTAIKDIDMYEQLIEPFCTEVKSERYKELRVFIYEYDPRDPRDITDCAIQLKSGYYHYYDIRDAGTNCVIRFENSSQYSYNIQKELEEITRNSLGIRLKGKKYNQMYLATIYGIVRYEDNSIIVSPIDGYREIITKLYENSKKMIIKLAGIHLRYLKTDRMEKKSVSLAIRAISRNGIYGK